MSKDYDVAVRWHTGSAAPETTTVHVEATTTAAALRLARRGIYLDHPGAAIDKTEIVYLETPAATTGNVTIPLAGGITALVAPDGEILSQEAAFHSADIENGAVEATFAQPNAAAEEGCSNETFTALIPQTDERDCLRCENTFSASGDEELCPACLRDPNPHVTAVVAAVPEAAAAVDCPTDRASALVAEIAKRYGTAASAAFLDAMDEFLGSRRAGSWTGSRLWITVAKVPELKRKAA